MSEEVKETQEQPKEHLVPLNEMEMNLILEDYDIAIKAPNGNVDVLYGRKHALRSKFQKAVKG
jgi:hypothetical protein